MFNPLIGKTQTVSVTSTHGEITLDTAGNQLMFTVESGGSTCFYRTGTTSATAVATTDTPLLSGEVAVFNRPLGHNIVSIVTSTGTATVYVTPGSNE